jgi:hypothetical protein
MQIYRGDEFKARERTRQIRASSSIEYRYLCSVVAAACLFRFYFLVAIQPNLRVILFCSVLVVLVVVVLLETSSSNPDQLLSLNA